MIKQDAIERSIDAIVDVIHERLGSLVVLGYPLTDDTNSNGVSGASKVSTCWKGHRWMTDGGGEFVLGGRGKVINFRNSFCHAHMYFLHQKLHETCMFSCVYSS